MTNLIPGYKTIVGAVLIGVVAVAQFAGIEVVNADVEALVQAIGTVLALLGIRFKAS